MHVLRPEALADKGRAVGEGRGKQGDRHADEEPDNAHALNALGYSLADRTDRYQEALQYIQKALKERPDDPAVIDSMGWVQYRLGNPEQALIHLRKALSLMPDAEIAALEQEGRANRYR